MMQFKQDWAEWFAGHYNWQEFTLIQLAFENDKVMGMFKFYIALFGLHFDFAIEGKPTPVRKKIERDRLIMMAHPDVAVNLREALKDIPDLLEKIEEAAEKHAPK